MFRLIGQRTLMGARATPRHLAKSVNNVTLVGVVHDIQSGFVYEDHVTQFTLTTTSIDTTNPTQECVVEKDHHTVRCFGDAFSAEMKGKVKEGNVVCVNGRLRLNPQLEPNCNKHFYFPFLHVQPPHGQVSIVHGDRRKVPPPQEPVVGDIPASTDSDASTSADSDSAATAAAESSSSATSTSEATAAGGESATEETEEQTEGASS